jgi:hypothetical protein
MDLTTIGEMRVWGIVETIMIYIAMASNRGF